MVRFERRCTIRLRPIVVSGSGNEASARRVLSIVPAASTPSPPGGTLIEPCPVSSETTRPLTVRSFVTWQFGTTIRRRFTSSPFDSEYEERAARLHRQRRLQLRDLLLSSRDAVEVERQLSERYGIGHLAAGDPVEEPLAQRGVHRAVDEVVGLGDPRLLGSLAEVELVEVGHRCRGP